MVLGRRMAMVLPSLLTSSACDVARLVGADRNRLRVFTTSGHRDKLIGAVPTNLANRTQVRSGALSTAGMATAFSGRVLAK